MIRNIANETDRAQTQSEVITVALGGAKRPKLTKIIASQKTTMNKKGTEIEPPACSKSSQRIWPRSLAMLSAWALSDVCVSFWGESCRRSL